MAVTTCLTALLRLHTSCENALCGWLNVLLFVSLIYLFLSFRNRLRRSRDHSDWPYVKLDQIGRIGHRQIIEQVRLPHFPTSIERIFEILDPKSSRILWINENTFISINGWSIKRFMEAPEMHRMLALDFTCSRRDGPWKRIHIYSRSSENAIEAVLLLMGLEHHFNTVDICCHHEIYESDVAFNAFALSPQHIRRILEPSLDIELGLEGLHFNPEQSEALACYAHSLNLGHNTTVVGDVFVTTLRKREHPIRSLSLRERPFDDVNWHHFLVLLAQSQKPVVRSLTLFHGCFVSPQDCPLLVNAHVEALTVHSSCLHDNGQTLVDAIASGTSPSHLHLLGYQTDIFVRVVHSLQEDTCSLKSLHVSLFGPQHDSQLQATLQAALTKNSSLESLTINNVLDVSRWVQAFTPLVSHRKMIKLSLNQVETITNESAKEMVRILETNRNIELTYSFLSSHRKRHRDVWEKTIEHTNRFNRFVRSSAPFLLHSDDSYREATFVAATVRHRHDPRRLGLLLSQNADLLANAKPLSVPTRQRRSLVGCKEGLSRFHQATQKHVFLLIQKVQNVVQLQVEDLLYLFCDMLIFSTKGEMNDSTA